MEVDEEMNRLILTNAPVGQIRQYALQRSMKPLRVDGLAKAAAGITTMEEVLRVTQET